MLFVFRMIVAASTASAALSLGDAVAQPAETAPLQLEAKIPLGSVRGRIDHMAVDLKRQRLFVAELGNDAVGIVDLANRKLVRTITGLKEPQGVGYEPSTDTLYVANAGDGSVQLFEGTDYAARERIELGSDADNIRLYGSSAIGRRSPDNHDASQYRALSGRQARRTSDSGLAAHTRRLESPRLIPMT